MAGSDASTASCCSGLSSASRLLAVELPVEGWAAAGLLEEGLAFLPAFLFEAGAAKPVTANKLSWPVKESISDWLRSWMVPYSPS